ncbi:sterol 24-C-methyltransferase [Hyaloraphidium curvatum]|nr:sterol 24-C-methyltransferase [Hyaloraphidium curvatum]
MASTAPATENGAAAANGRANGAADAKSAIHFTKDAAEASFISKMAKKNLDAESRATHERVAQEYSEAFKRAKAENGEGVADVHEQKRLESAHTLTRAYYDLVTDFYEYAWGDSFHFARMYAGDTLSVAVKRHETYLAHKLELVPGMKVLDVGCGVGGPLREMARFSGADVTGINFNGHQVERVNHYCKKFGLDGLTRAVKGNFLDMPFEAEQFDAAYSIEAACHAPRPSDVMKEIFRVLKPGGVYAAYEWCLTDKYDPNNKEHVDIMHELATGNSIPKWYTTEEWKQCLVEVGFEVIEDVDLAYEHDIVKATNKRPWYWPLTTDLSALWTLEGITIGWLRQPWGRSVTSYLTRFLELIRLAPPGTTTVSQFLDVGAHALVRSGETQIFTPMYYFKARKPLAAGAPAEAASPVEGKVGGI